MEFFAGLQYQHLKRIVKYLQARSSCTSADNKIIEVIPPVINVFEPLTMKWLPSFLADVVSPATSEPQLGSVMARLEPFFHLQFQARLYFYFFDANLWIGSIEIILPFIAALTPPVPQRPNSSLKITLIKQSSIPGAYFRYQIPIPLVHQFFDVASKVFGLHPTRCSMALFLKQNF